jgi:hypothetical protein
VGPVKDHYHTARSRNAHHDDFDQIEVAVLRREFADLAAFDVGDVGDGAHDFRGVNREHCRVPVPHCMTSEACCAMSRTTPLGVFRVGRGRSTAIHLPSRKAGLTHGSPA